MKDNEYFVIFGGGGIRGLSYCGAYQALIEHDIKLTGCAGSSIGSVFASLLAVGYNHNEIFDLLCSGAGLEMFIDINIDFKKEIAFSKGKIFLEWIREKIEKKFYADAYKKGEMAPVKFRDLNYNLIIYSVDLTNLKFHEFSSAKTPDFEIARAVRASVSMPGLFTPLEIDGNLIVDGDLLKSTPLWRLSDTIKNSKDRIMEFRLEDNETPKKISNSLEYLNRVYNAICGFATDYIVDLYKEKDRFDYIKINTQDISVVDFLIPKEKKKELFDIGYQKTKDYFVDFYPQKRIKLLKKYQDLIALVLNFQKDFNKNSYINANLKLCELFIFLCEEKRYLDSDIYQEIVQLKNEFQKNYKNIKFFMFKKSLIRNKEEISNLILNLVKSLTCKVRDLEN